VSLIVQMKPLSTVRCPLVYEYVIVGSSAGAIGAIEALREVDPSGSLLVITEEPLPAYSRPMIGEYLIGKATLEKMAYRGESFWVKKRVELLKGREMVGVDFQERSIELDDGERINYDKLLLATGSNPYLPDRGERQERRLHLQHNLRRSTLGKSDRGRR